MTIFANRETLALSHAGATKWERLLTALDQGGALCPEVAHSIGDSLTYWRTSSQVLAADVLMGHRRYQTVLAVLDGACQVRTLPTVELAVAKPYCDLDDAEYFAQPDSAEAEFVTLSPGQILAVPIDHAWQVASLPEAELVIVHLTVEGATFHNK